MPRNTLPPIRLGPQPPTGPNPILAPDTSHRRTKLVSHHHHHRFLNQPIAPCRAYHALSLARTTCTTHSTRTSFVAATSAPRSSSSFTTSTWPYWAEKCSAVCPLICEQEHTSTLQPPRLPSTPCQPHSTIPSSAGTHAPCLLPCHALHMLTSYASSLVAQLHPTSGPSPSLALTPPYVCTKTSLPPSFQYPALFPLPCSQNPSHLSS